MVSELCVCAMMEEECTCNNTHTHTHTHTHTEGEGSAESSESSGEEEVVPVHVSKQKSLQARRSILEHIDDNLMKPMDEPPTKRAKRDEAIVSCTNNKV